MDNKTVLITGASSGIGYELAKLFAKDKYNLILVTRNLDQLTRVTDELHRDFNVNVIAIAKDLALPDTAQELFANLQQKNIRVDILVNNAGVGLYGDFRETNLEKELAMMELNMNAVVALTKLFLPHMLEQKYGKILNTASTASFQPGPGMAIYYATKAFVLSFSEAIAEELRNTGVTVTTLCPGPTKTKFFAGMEASKLTHGDMMDVSTVARAGYDGLMRGNRTVIPGFKNKIFVQLLRITPRRWVTTIVRKLQEKI